MQNDIVLKGGYGLGNFGDDALMYWAVKIIRLRRPESRILLDCNKAGYIKAHVDVSFDLSSVKPGALLIYGGGTLYYNFPKQNASWLSRFTKGLKSPFLVYRWVTIKLENHVKRPDYSRRIMLGMGFGPFHSKKSPSYLLALEDISSADQVMVRDSTSLEFCSLLRNDVVAAADLCYAAIGDVTFEKKAVSKVASIGIILRDWDSGTESDDYLEKTYTAACRLREEGFDVTFLVFSARADKNFVRLLKTKGEVFATWSPADNSIQEFIDRLGDFSLIISSRFHGLVFATLLKIPSIAVVIEPKLRLSVENAVVEVWDPITDTSDDLAVLVREISKEYEKYVFLCEQKIDSNRRRVEACLDIVFECQGRE